MRRQTLDGIVADQKAGILLAFFCIERQVARQRVEQGRGQAVDIGRNIEGLIVEILLGSGTAAVKLRFQHLWIFSIRVMIGINSGRAASHSR